ncbi:MAG: FAD/NAD(P)-binding protein [Atribacterota bacterium]|nr:FAD/NAD(P)-binding protein [Atribacterota bacterium]
MKTLKLKNSEYEIKKGRILRTKKITNSETLFEIVLPKGENLNHEPGQFVMVSLLGVGEAPFSVSSSPTKLGSFELVIRNIGKLTGVLHRLKAGDEVGIRGPFGKGFPVHILEGSDLLFVAGGLGIVPLHSLINYAIDNRKDFGKVNILLGCGSPEDILFSDELNEWTKRLDVSFECTVDRADSGWKGNIGLITALIPGVNLVPLRTFAVVVGPPIMYKFVIKELIEKGIPERQILISLERHMKCGLGKCGHCQINGLYCCQEGPVFSYAKIKNIRESIS